MVQRPSSSGGSSRKALSVYSGRAAGPNFVIPERLSFENVIENKTCPVCRFHYPPALIFQTKILKLIMSTALHRKGLPLLLPLRGLL